MIQTFVVVYFSSFFHWMDDNMCELFECECMTLTLKFAVTFLWLIKPWPFLCCQPMTSLSLTLYLLPCLFFVLHTSVCIMCVVKFGNCTSVGYITSECYYELFSKMYLDTILRKTLFHIWGDMQQWFKKIPFFNIQFCKTPYWETLFTFCTEIVLFSFSCRLALRMLYVR